MDAQSSRNILIFKSISLLCVVLISIMLVNGCNGEADGDVDAGTAATWNEAPLDEPPVAVEAVTAAKGSLVPAVQASGIIAGGNEAYAVLEVGGIITEVRFKLGDFVQTGDILVRVDDRLPAAALELAEEQYATARLDFEATEASRSRGAVSTLEYQRSKNNLVSAKVNYEQALKRYQDCTLRAPIDGYVAGTDGAITVGNLASVGIRAAYIVDVSSYRMELSVGERDISLVEKGLSASVFLADGNKLVTDVAIVTAVAAGSDRSTGSFPVVLEWEGSLTDVRPGMSARAVITVEEPEPEILVPASVLLSREGRPFVYAVRDGIAEPLVVETETRRGNLVRIISGLEEGEVIAFTGLTSLAPGDRVTATIIGTSENIR